MREFFGFAFRRRTVRGTTWVMELVAFGALLLSPLVMLGFGVLWWMSASARAGADAVWRDYASSRRLTFIPAQGDWPNRMPSSIVWSEGGTEYRLQGAGDESSAATTLVARIPAGVAGTFTLRPTTSMAAPGTTGDPLIDSRFVVDGVPHELATVILTPDVKRSLVGFDVGARGALTYAAGEVVVSWSSREMSASRLDEARTLVRLVVHALVGAGGNSQSEGTD